MIYFDNAATTVMRKEAYEKMQPYLMESYGNPSGNYRFADISYEAMEKAREDIAEALKVKPCEIYFTSGGSEADNWAVKSTAQMMKNKGSHIITTKIEHPAVLNSCRYLENQGYTVTYLGVDENGMIRLKQLERAIEKGTILISVMTANNEIGTIEPIEQIGYLAKKYNILFHTDAVQACGHVPIDIKKCNISMLSASGHKFGGPKGIGFLYIRDGINLPPFIHGGSQEKGKRAGTGNVAAAVAMGEAMRLSEKNIEHTMKKKKRMRDYAIDRILREIPYSRLNGDRYRRLPGNMNFSFQFVNGGELMALLDTRGICVSTSSACSSKSDKPSYVLKETGLSDSLAKSSIRVTISENTTKEEIDYLIKELKENIFRLRKLPPL